MDEIERGTTQDGDSRRRSHHRCRENLERGLSLGAIDETMTDLIFGEAPSETVIVGPPLDTRDSPTADRR